MSETIRIACPSCGQGYKVPEAKLGQQAACKKCGKPFVLEQPKPAPNPNPPTAILQAAPPPPKREKGRSQLASKKEVAEAEIVEADGPHGLWENLKSWHKSSVEAMDKRRQEMEQNEADKEREQGYPNISKTTQLNFVAGPLNAPTNHPLFCYLDPNQDSGIVIFKMKGVFDFSLVEVFGAAPLSAVKGIEVETAERLSLGRAGIGYLIAGPFGGILGAMFKKKDTFLRIDIDENGVESSIVLAKGRHPVEQFSNQLMIARREIAPKQVDQTKAPTTESDIEARLEKLERLNAKGLLRPEEYEKKRATLLDEM